MDNRFTIKQYDGPLQALPDYLVLDHYMWLDNGCRPEVRVWLAYSHEALRILFRVYEENPLARFTRLNDPVYKDSCVEFFLQPTPGTDNRYLNFELNALGTLLLGLGEGRAQREYLNVDPALLGIQTSTVCVDPADGRSFWELQFSIPFSWLIASFPDFLPQPGTRMRGNLYKCGDETAFPHYGAWSRVTSPTPDFHRSCDFGELLLG